MTLVHIEVEAFRNLRRVTLTLDPHVNLIYGDNASGKTSLLESIHVLARGRSFTRVRSDQLIGRGKHGFVLGARIKVGSHVAWLGMERTRGGTRVRLDGRAVETLSEIAWLLPIHTINTESHRLVVSGPKERRSALDWGVFHVEQNYQDCWRRFYQALRQRNAALQARDSRLAMAWEPDLVTGAEAVDTSRRGYLDTLWPAWHGFMTDWLPELDLRWVFYSGWPQESALREILAQARPREIERGHTIYGPHRGDLRFTVDGVDAGQRLSRGQQKLVVIAFRLAQAAVTARSGRQRPILLVDDLAAELDLGRRERVLGALLLMDAQVFLTALTREDLRLTGCAHQVFHVEQGTYCKMV
ncbi:MAG: DNA replication/repair protein RecF [Nitrococcus sp.]|nr:DNA replication/repair protein RecF [Nitrococcus sp.]